VQAALSARLGEMKERGAGGKLSGRVPTQLTHSLDTASRLRYSGPAELPIQRLDRHPNALR